MIFTNQHRLFVAMATVILSIGLASCGAGLRGVATVANTNDTTVLDYPIIDRYSPGGTLDIRRIVLTDSSTTIHFSAKYRPKNWIFIDTASYIIAKDGNVPFKSSTLPPALLSEIYSLFDMTDPRLLEGGNAEYLVYGVNDSNADWKAVLGDRGKLLYDLKDADLIYIPRIKAGNIKDEELREFIEEELREFTSHCHPFAAAILESMDSELAEARKADIYKSGFKDVPEGSGDELFDKIIAPYKGKIVLVDFWNTWCGPCAMAMNSIEPYKSGELSSDEIVWLYIANTTSPYVEYQKRIKEIKGVHYRLSKEQWDSIAHKKFNIYGIPAYVLVHKDGTYEFREDFLFHDTLISALKSML